MNKEKLKTMVYIRAVARSCMPFIGIAVIIALTDEKKFFLSVLAIPLFVAVPVIIWSTKKIIDDVLAKRLINRKYIISYGLSLIFIAAGVCFFSMIDAALSHGADHGLFFDRCLFVITFVVVYPLVDLIQFRITKQLAVESVQKIKYQIIISKALILAVAVILLIKIIGPTLNAAMRLQYRSIAKELINYGADVKKKDRYGATPLWYAVHRVDLEITKLLLNKGAKLDATSASLGLQRAVERKNTDMLKLLLSSGADPNSKYMGAPPLVGACQRKDTTMIRILLDSGADINLKSKYPNMPYDGKSPLDEAHESGDTKIVELLLGHVKKQ